MSVATRKPPRTTEIAELDEPRTEAEAPLQSNGARITLVAAALVVVAAGAGAWLLATSGDGDKPPARGDASSAAVRSEPPVGGAPARMPTMDSRSMPAGMQRDRDSAARASAGSATQRVRVELDEMYVKPNVRSVPEGKVTFVVRNVGKLDHELIVSRVPVMMEAPGMPDHDAGLGMTEHIGPGGEEKLTLRMRPGTYELFCNVPGHYAAGQKLRFRVRPS